MAERILVSDVGSTTTKLLLLELGPGGFSPLGTAAVGTTVEKPTEDVCAGFFQGVSLLSKKTGIQLLDGSGELTLPFFTTSSAGGGLQILVIALASSYSGTMAKATAFNAGGVIIDSFAIDDETPRVEKIRRLRHLSPDLVLMAGGYENGAVAGVINMAQLIALSRPKPKYGSGNIPLVFCGNTAVRPYLKGILGDQFSITFADNIRPDGLHFNLKPAITEVHRLFMDHVMQMAPGYHRLSSMVSSPVIPTPAGVERILELYSRNIPGGVVMADMGGATTDIFSRVGEQFQRTVAANTGMSYSLSNILREAEPENVFRHIPGVGQGPGRNWVLGKTLFPTTVPRCGASLAVEGAAAAEGMRLAWRHHLNMGYQRHRVGLVEKMRRLVKCKFDSAFSTPEGDPFRISSIDVIIGAGGIMAHSSPRRTAWILTSGFRPKGLTLLMVDRHFQSPHMGVLSVKYPEQALKYYAEECLVPVARVYAPVKKTSVLKVNAPGGTIKVGKGECVYIESSTGVSIPGVSLPEDGLPLVIDLRYGEETIPLDFGLESRLSPEEMNLPSSPSVPPEMGILNREYSLSYPGEMKVSSGDAVAPGDLLGENRLIPPRVFFVDVRARVGYDRKDITDEMVMENIEVRPGDRVSSGDCILSMKCGGGLIPFTYNVTSPVRGEVTSVGFPGLITMKEIQDYDGKPHFVNVAAMLGVKPRRIGSYMKVRLGEFVQKSQCIASGERLSNIKSPATGTVEEIDRKTGVVKIQYVLKPVRLHSPVAGQVTHADPAMSAVISSPGAVVPGIAGFGGLRHGKLITGEPERNCVLLLDSPPDARLMELAARAEIAGMIAPSIDAGVLVEYLGEEPGVILTGQERVPFSLVILRGVGNIPLEPDVYAALAAFSGGNCALFTTTRLRAGVERPFVFLQPMED